MELKQLFDDDSAVSPVIGVILMVAITVILAAVIATFVLGLGEQVSDTAPQASFSFETSGSSVTVTHDGGATLENANVEVRNSTETISPTGSGFGTEIQAGDSATYDVGTGTGTLRVVWTNSAGTDSATLSTYDYDTN